MTKKKHGGRRHGLDSTGPAAKRNLVLGEIAGGSLDHLIAVTGESGSEIVRRLVTHPDALLHATDPGSEEKQQPTT